jgi:hypothetical protein
MSRPPFDAVHLWLEYCRDPHRDDDLKRWNGNITTGDFKRFKHALQSGHLPTIQHMLDNHMQSPELSCTYHNKHNHRRWRRAEDLIIKHTKPGDVVVDIGAGSHASMINMLLMSAPDRKYIICDLTSPLLLACHNVGTTHDVKYVNLKDFRPSDIQQSLMDLLNTHDCIMLPHHLCYMLYHVPIGSTFYNSYSFGEMSSDEVSEYMDIISVTQSQLISENYWNNSAQVQCHLCSGEVQPVEQSIPGHMSCTYQRDPHVPTNTGAKIVVYEP